MGAHPWLPVSWGTSRRVSGEHHSVQRVVKGVNRWKRSSVPATDRPPWVAAAWGRGWHGGRETSGNWREMRSGSRSDPGACGKGRVDRTSVTTWPARVGGRSVKGTDGQAGERAGTGGRRLYRGAGHVILCYCSIYRQSALFDCEKKTFF